MGRMTELAKENLQGAGRGPTHTLYIGGEDVSQDLKSVRVTHRAEGGGSGGEFTLFGDYAEYSNAPVRLWLGYGDYQELYFAGDFRRPAYRTTTGKSEATAFGPFKLMAEQQLNTDETYQGRTLGFLIYDLANRCSYGPGQIEVISGDKFVVPPGKRFLFYNSCGSVAKDILSEAEYVGADVVGGKRLFRPRPVPGANVGYDTLWSPDDYAPGAFTADYEETKIYSRVEVSRKDQGGNTIFRESRDVDPRNKFNPRRNEVFSITDFPGTKSEALYKAEEIAQKLRIGEQPFEFQMPMNSEVELYGGFMLEEEAWDQHKGVIRRTLYSCTIDGDIVLDYSPGSGSSKVSGSSYEISREEERVDTPNYGRRYSSVVGVDT